jgi:prepilin-type N-terminal cleavage/methylation domain-containing protein
MKHISARGFTRTNFATQNLRGFTLIELLIVIALLGALAVGLLATIDPFEQLKKGRDTSMRNTVSEFYNANLRYYSTKAAFPWTGTLATTSVYALSSNVNLLVNAGELKNNFFQLAGTGNLDKIYVTSTSVDHVAVCYEPESKGFQIDPNTMYDRAGGVVGNCKSGTAGTAGIACDFCIQ